MDIKITSSSYIIQTGHTNCIDLASSAANQCIKQSSLDSSAIDLLVNIGISRNDNIFEPAIASLIQKRIGMNINESDFYKGCSTFSFDILNSYCGFFSALLTIDALLKTGTAQNALIVSSDVHPSGDKVATYPYSPAGAAMLLNRSSDTSKGFQRIFFKTDSTNGFGFTNATDIYSHGNRLIGQADIQIQGDYIPLLMTIMQRTLLECMSLSGVNAKSVKLITSEPSPGFCRELATTCGIPEKMAFDLYNRCGDTYTSSPIVGYSIAIEEHFVEDNDMVIFVSGGSGLTTAAASYRV